MAASDYEMMMHETISNIGNCNFIYATHWYTIDKNIYAIGSAENNEMKKIQLQCNTALFVWCRDRNDLLNICGNLKYIDYTRKVECYNLPLKITGITALDEMIDSDVVRGNTQWCMFRIPTLSHKYSLMFHKLLNSNAMFCSLIKTLVAWNLEKQLMLELYLKHGNWDKTHLYNVWIDSSLNYKEGSKKFDTVAIDIETVSHEKNRLPQGNHRTDVLFSVAISVISTENENVHYTMVNLPVKDTMSDIMKCIRDEEKLPFNLQRRVEIYRNEIDLLTRVVSFLVDYPRQYILLGYNSKGYDMPFLVMRLVYLSLSLKRHIYLYNGIFVLGLKMIHIDVMEVLQKYYKGEVSSFALKNMTKKCLNYEEKIDVNAVLIRFVYYDLLSDGLNDGNFPKYDLTLSKILRYNDVDTILTAKMWINMGYDTFIPQVSKTMRLSLYRVSQSMVNEYLTNLIILNCFKINYILSLHPTFVVTYNSERGILVLCNNEALSSPHFDVTRDINDCDKVTSYGGGFNYRSRKHISRDVVMADMVCYYPSMMESGLSPETTTILPSNRVNAIISEYTRKSDLIFNIFTSHKELSDQLMNINLRTFAPVASSIKRSVDVRNDENIATIVDSKLYVNGFRDNASDFKYNDINFNRLNERIVIRISNKYGFISRIMKRQNMIRSIAKESMKKVDNIIRILEKYLNDINLGYNEENSNMDEDEDFNPDEDCDQTDFNRDSGEDFNPDEDEDFEIEKKIDYNTVTDFKTRDLPEDEDERLVSCEIILLNDSQIITMNKVSVERYLEIALGERARLFSLYRNYKIINNSFYGLLGSLSGSLRCKTLAAILTMFGRKYIIDTAIIGESNGYECILIDTDSVFLRPRNTSVRNVQNIIQSVNKLNNKLLLNSKTYSTCLIIAKKVYISMYNEPFSRGISKNGPILWERMMFNVFEKYIISNRVYMTMNDLKDALYDMYIETYKHLKFNKNDFLCWMNIKAVEEYKTNTFMKKMMQRVYEENPNFIFSKSASYFYLYKNKPNNVFCEIYYKLADTPLADLNLYKFYYKITLPLYHIFSAIISKTYLDRDRIYVTFTYKDFDEINKNQFIMARNNFSKN